MRWQHCFIFVTLLVSRAEDADSSVCSEPVDEACQRQPKKQQHLKIPEKVDVAVVGGGLAGLSAAFVLTRHLNIKRVLILEAKEKLGGRIEVTDREVFGGVAANIGANWIHFAENNPVTRLAEQLGCPLLANNNSNLIWSAAGLGVLPSDAVEGAANFAQTLARRACKGAPSNETAARHLATVAKHMADVGETTATTEAARHLHFFSDVVLDHTAYLSRMSGAGLDAAPAGGDADGHDLHLGGENGAGCLVAGILAGLPQESGGRGAVVRTGVPVKEIRLLEEASRFPIDLVFDTLAGAHVRHVRAKAVLVAVPLGVLRESSGEGVARGDEASETQGQVQAQQDGVGLLHFAPRIPPIRLARWRRVGVGQSLRAALLFDEAFWDERIEHFGYLLGFPNQTTSDVPTRNEDLFYGEALTVEFNNLVHVSGRPVLLAEVSWDLADQLEKLDDVQIGRFLVERALKPMFAEAAVPHPRAVAVKRFRADPYIRGALSFPSVAQGTDGLRESIKSMEKESEEKYGEDDEDENENYDDDYEDEDESPEAGEKEEKHAALDQHYPESMWAPLWSGRLFVAGEHASSRPGTLDGALLSGIQSAWSMACTLGKGVTAVDPVTLVEELGIFDGWFKNVAHTRNCLRRFVKWLGNQGKSGCSKRWLDLIEESCRRVGRPADKNKNHRNCLDQGD